MLEATMGIRGRPFRAVLGVQLVCTVLLTAIAGWVSGGHGAFSATLGGAVGIFGGLAFVWMASRSHGPTADAVLVSALKAEALKVLLFIVLLAVVLSIYRNVVVVWLIGSFIPSAMIFGFAFFVRDS